MTQSWQHQPPLYRRLDLLIAEVRSIEDAAQGEQPARLAHVRRELSGILVSSAPALTLLSDWLDTYQAILERRGLAHNTLANYRAVTTPLNAALGRHALGAVRTFDLAAFIHRYVTRGQLHAARFARTVCVDVFAEAIAAGYLDHNPASSLRTVKAPVRRKRLSLDLWWQAHAAAAEHAPWVQHALELAVVTGQRRADIAQARFSDVQGGYLHVVQQKTAVRLRLNLDIRLDAVGLSIGDVVERCRSGARGRYLVRHREDRGQMRRGAALHPQTLSNRFRDLMKACPVRMKNCPTFHEQRSLSARLHRDQGREPQLLLGHRSAAMTAIYCDSRGAEWVEVN